MDLLKNQTKENFDQLRKQTDTLGLKITALEKLIARLSEKIDQSGGGALPFNNKPSLLSSKLTGNGDDSDDRLARLEK